MTLTSFLQKTDVIHSKIITLQQLDKNQDAQAVSLSYSIKHVCPCYWNCFNFESVRRQAYINFRLQTSVEDSINLHYDKVLSSCLFTRNIQSFWNWTHFIVKSTKQWLTMLVVIFIGNWLLVDLAQIDRQHRQEPSFKFKK